LASNPRAVDPSARGTGPSVAPGRITWTRPIAERTASERLGTTVPEFSYSANRAMSSIDLPWQSVRTDMDLLTAMECLGTFRQFRALLDRASLADDLASDRGHTVFAPTDAAFDRLSLEVRTQLANAPAELLIDVAEHHLIRGKVLLDNLAGASSFVSLQGSSLTVDRGQVAGVALVRADLTCSNGVLHALDGLLCPDYGAPSETIEERLRRFIRDRAQG
jgi:hypothetical protein